ncbi:hypothetical protein [Morganella morganii]|uniref:hypothetical protein n=1 Tax=Morganella morganii TaxID=582 RepID=UPI0038907AE0
MLTKMNQEMLKPVRGLWLIVSIVMFNLIPVLIHGGVLPLTNFLIFNAFAIPAVVLLYRKKTRRKKYVLVYGYCMFSGAVMATVYAFYNYD